MLHGAEEAEAEEESPGHQRAQEKGLESMAGTGMRELATQLARVAGILRAVQEKGPSSMLDIDTRVLEIRHANAVGTLDVE
jgi:hypothetical protein